ncbi:GNAT family protein [Thermobifida fusca]|jgi:[ribosomal protein S5]-alanine N-acetyltransferase|uniref:Ribosomal-protein-alanine N-acetyltransferase n=2 Tax=Thermobifida fusca TaxID=2021 RepID=A0A9P2WS40_THEFU|nr:MULTISPECIES: GNAT family protein [Thermobifida]AAZ54415.1 ribosomal-protein-alanine N-acetyltransferase [Thermobifida fusca YX]EOR72496.1 ribosomal-protein-alanine N-acetyltransferase [Thermobifida fusca TM51]MBO2529724.1 N-acetyltransferase [Thermobifida sp.]MDD6792509.1 GNAT family protein [Thermobifida fusca]PPS95555.1 GNAT family acetyltransferase [Thermobifida fusca]
MRGWPVSLAEGKVVLRPLRLRDAPALRETRARNSEWLRPWEPTHPELPPQSDSLLAYVAMVQSIRREARQGIAMPWAITWEGRFIGQITVGAITWGSARSAQIGYWIDRDYAGRGVMPTAVALAVDHAFFTVGLHRVEANIRPENHKSRRVVEKLGFREEGLRKRQLHIDGEWRDHLCYALTVEDVPGGLLARWRKVREQRGDTVSEKTRGASPGRPDRPH